MERKFREPGAAPAESKSSKAATLTPAGLDRGDVSLIHWMLTLTPTERLEAAQDFADSMAELRNAREIAH
jgi:hypothetical protein